MARKSMPAGPGRPKGCKNKFTELKQQILEALEKRGGPKFFEEVSENNFVKLIAELLPKKIEQENKNSGSLEITIKHATVEDKKCKPQ